MILVVAKRVPGFVAWLAENEPIVQSKRQTPWLSSRIHRLTAVVLFWAHFQLFST
jgi:hypothetical protein